MANICEFCGIELHLIPPGLGFEENKEPNCPKNPSGPQRGHRTASRFKKIEKSYG